MISFRLFCYSCDGNTLPYYTTSTTSNSGISVRGQKEKIKLLAVMHAQWSAAASLCAIKLCVFCTVRILRMSVCLARLGVLVMEFIFKNTRKTDWKIKGLVHSYPFITLLESKEIKTSMISSWFHFVFSSQPFYVFFPYSNVLKLSVF